MITIFVLFSAKLVPVAYGIKKLQMSMVVEDDKVSKTRSLAKTSLKITPPNILYIVNICKNRLEIKLKIEKTMVCGLRVN